LLPNEDLSTSRSHGTRRICRLSVLFFRNPIPCRRTVRTHYEFFLETGAFFSYLSTASCNTWKTSVRCERQRKRKPYLRQHWIHPANGVSERRLFQVSGTFAAQGKVMKSLRPLQRERGKLCSGARQPYRRRTRHAQYDFAK
jgi:hypothetical protein